MDAEERRSRIRSLCEKVWKEAEREVLLRMRFLGSSLSVLKKVPDENSSPAATDGEFLYYDPFYLLKSYKEEEERIPRLLLHVLIHCIFRHPFVNREKVSRRYWDLSCDIQAAFLVDRMIPYKSREQTVRERILGKLQEEIRPLTAEGTYRFLQKERPLETDLKHMEEIFTVDDHSLWYGNETGEKNGSGSEKDEKGDVPVETDVSLVKESRGGKEDTAFVPVKNAWDMEQVWTDISRKIELELEMAETSFGEGKGDLIEQIQDLFRDRKDYTEFLRRFAVIGEDMRINDEEFDYIFYSYGMKLYGDMPLIEPLEYKDVKKIREFVIVVDTSESVSGKLVQSFICKTYNLLKSSESYFTKVNIHVIQCGAGVESDVKITDPADLDRLFQGMVLKGFGGTDFRPAFDYVERLVEAHEFTDLKGMIYFTDGCGTYPEQKPPFDTVFVFFGNTPAAPRVPVWAMKVLMDEI